MLVLARGASILTRSSLCRGSIRPLFSCQSPCARSTFVVTDTVRQFQLIESVFLLVTLDVLLLVRSRWLIQALTATKMLATAIC